MMKYNKYLEIIYNNFNKILVIIYIIVKNFIFFLFNLLFVSTYKYLNNILLR